MKNAFKILSLFLLVSISSFSQVNKYGLKVITKTEDYSLQVSENDSLELVDLEELIPNIKLDIVYATPNNFTGEVIYKSPKAFLRKYVALSLLEVQKELNKKGLGLKVFDAYRPYSATVRFYEVYPDKTFVASPKSGSIHNRASAVDLTIIDLKTGKELEMPTLFDSFSEKASHNYTALSDEVLENRKLLKDIMYKHGFDSYTSEWWHYNSRDSKKYDIMDISFEELMKLE